MIKFKYNIVIIKNKRKKKDNIAPINEELNVVTYETENIRKLIYTIRSKQVMIDSDVAMLYHCETKYINRVVKRNIERFPEEFCFQLTEKEFQNYGGRRYLPYVFTEQGIAMISALLKSEIAVKVSINIMKANYLKCLKKRGHCLRPLSHYISILG